MGFWIFLLFVCFFFFFNDTATTEIYTLSLHDALPISGAVIGGCTWRRPTRICARHRRSEEHTSELQSRGHLVCRLLLEKQKKNKYKSDKTNRIINKITAYNEH